MQLLGEREREKRAHKGGGGLRVYEYCSPDLLIIDAQTQEVTWDQTYSPLTLPAWLRVFLSPCHCLAQSSGAETFTEEREICIDSGSLSLAAGFVLQGVPFVGEEICTFPALIVFVSHWLIFQQAIFPGVKDSIASIIEALLCSQKSNLLGETEYWEQKGSLCYECQLMNVPH